jgi:hypothetical protein
VISPGPRTCHSLGLLGPMTGLLSLRVSLLIKESLHVGGSCTDFDNCAEGV